MQILFVNNWSEFSNTSVTTQQTQNICITFVQRRPNVFDVGPALYKHYTNVLCLLRITRANGLLTKRPLNDP